MDGDAISLLERFLDDSIDADGAKALLARLESDAAFRGDFTAALRMQGLLHASLDRDASCERLAEVVGIAIRAGDRSFDSRVMDGIKARGLGAGPRRRFLKIAAIAAAALMAVFAGALLLHRPGPIMLAAAGSDVKVKRGADAIDVAGGMSLLPGDAIVTPARGWASVRYADGTAVEIGADASVTVEPGPGKRLRVDTGLVTAEVAPQPSDAPMILHSRDAEARVLGTSLALLVYDKGARLVVREGKVAFSRGVASIEVKQGQSATAAEGTPLVAESLGREVLRKFGKDHFMLGIMSGYGESWVEDVKGQGARFDLRYQHLSPGWKNWNSGGGFIPLYLKESDRLGVSSVFSYYALIQASPGRENGLGPAGAIAVNCTNRDTMKKYLTDLVLFMRKAGEYGRPLILHVEPEVWGHFLSAPEFSPHKLEDIKVVVKSTGLPEFEGLDDTLVSFGRAFGLLRDRYAPNVLLAWHASRRGDRTPREVADALRISGRWDLIFTDVGDRDAAYREIRGDAGGWWTEKDFADLRAWGAELHERSGLPLVVWRIPLGNKVMAACNNTPWHYMDNRAEYWLENYPENRHIAEWAAAGFVGLLFGGGTVECTVHKDSAKDGVTNPAPIPGNRGETSSFPDDDGGYLRLRAGNYYKKGPLSLPGH
ncbi:MAG TPA: FecR family protein [Planctomycetota bacterium]|nr:FecR family protein [Planctomycetota bacterium]